VATTEEAYNKLNLPSLPASIKELIVTFAPWLALLGGVLGLLVLIPGTLLMLVISPVAAMGGGALGFVGILINLTLGIAGAVLSLMAFSGLRQRSLRGWVLLFWACILYLVGGLFPLSIGSLFGVVIGGALSLYLLFQVKPYYDGRIAPAA
jgi:hypothetical protein